MPLLAGDIRFAQSVNMADVPEGGGPPSAKLLTSGKSNEIFPDVSEESRTSGRVEVYQIHSLLRNNDRDALYGGNVILAKTPSDPHVAVTLLSLKNPFATRAEIARRIESGMAAASEWNGYLLEDHFTTMRTVQLLQRPGMPPPVPGKTFILIHNEGAPNEKRQRIRIKSVETTERLFTEIVNSQLTDFVAQVSQCEIFDGLLYDFTGSPPSRFFARQGNKTLIRETVYSDSGLFVSAAPLTKATAINDNWLQLASIYTQVVPNSRTESVSVDQRPAARRAIVLQESPRRVEVAVSRHTQRVKIGESNAGQTFVLQCQPLPEPNTVVIDYWSMGQRYSVSDNGQGELTGSGGGAVSYLTGSIALTLKAPPDIGSAITLSYGERAAFHNALEQAKQAQWPQYFFTIADAAIDASDAIVPGTLTIEYLSDGQMRTVSDDGAGRLQGSGTGVVQYHLRLVQMQPQYLPDAGSALEANCQVHSLVVEHLAAPPPDVAGFVQLNLAQSPAPGTLEIQWATLRKVSQSSGARVTSSNQSKSSTPPTAGALPVPDLAFSYTEVNQGNQWSEPPKITVGSSGSSASSGAEITTRTRTAEPGSGGSSSTHTSSHTTVSEEKSDASVVVWQSITDDGAGGFVEHEDGQPMGSVSYAAKTVSLRAVTRTQQVYSYQSDHERASEFENDSPSGGGAGGDSNKGGKWGMQAVEEQLALSSMTARYSTGTGVARAVGVAIAAMPVVLRATPLTAHAVVSGSVMFQWGGSTYVDFEGKMYRDRTNSSPGILSGTIDYASGTVVLTDWPQDASAAIGDVKWLSLWTHAGHWSCASVFFCTEAAPLRPGPGGFVLTAVDTRGNALTAHVDAHGDISGPHLHGRVDFARGGVELQFGDFVNDDALSDAQKQEWWYDAQEVGAVHAGKIWQPHPIDPATLRYSCVSFIYLPVDVTLMGIDPSALPSDGRAAFVRPGDLCVIGQTHEGAAFAPAVGNTYNVGHTRLSFVQVIDDATGHEIREGYTHDLDAGTVTFTDLTGWPAQVRVIGRTEVYRMAAEVRIDGKVRLTQPIGHVFDAGAICSSALRQGDRFARVEYVFDQRGWDGFTWMDGLNPQNEASPANYNRILYPVQVTNLGAITERWALRFHSTTHFVLIGEHLGQIAAGNVNEDFAPINPASGAPYFTITSAGWGGGWAVGDVLFMKTTGAEFPIACVRCIMPSTPLGIDDSAWIVQRGDVARAPHP